MGSAAGGRWQAETWRTGFGDRYKRNTGETDLSIRVAAIQKGPWFTNGTRVPYAQAGLTCSIIVRYANGATLEGKTAPWQLMLPLMR